MKKFVRIRTMNSSARPLRRAILVDDWSVCRLGSLTATEDCFDFTSPHKVIEVNTVDAIENSRSKLRMKACFTKGKVPQAAYWKCMNDLYADPQKDFPIVIKRVFGFQGRGMSLIHNQTELDTWRENHPYAGVGGDWFAETFYNYSREYRLHVGRGVGVFLSWRKLRLAKAKVRWYFNSDNCEWYGEDHELFDRPKCWKKMCKAAEAALKSTGLDIGAVDIRVQSNKQHDPQFIVCEINSAPALAEVGIERYKEVIKKIINLKKNDM